MLYSPLLEELHRDRHLWYDMLAADVVMCAPLQKRQHYLSLLCREFPVSLEKIKTCASEIGGEKETRPIILVHGEPTCVFNPQVNGHLFSSLEEDFRLLHLPMAEYFLFLWMDEGLECGAQQKEIQDIHGSLGRFSPYSPCATLLRQAADDAIGKLSGANGRYRLAKSILSAEAAMATIEVAPLYENVAALLNLVSEGSAIKPLLRLPVNGEGVEKQRLETFLHFLKEHHG